MARKLKIRENEKYRLSVLLSGTHFPDRPTKFVGRYGEEIRSFNELVPVFPKVPACGATGPLVYRVNVLERDHPLTGPLFHLKLL